MIRRGAVSSTNGEFTMTKSQIYAIRAQVHDAMTIAHNHKTPYSPLIRMEWKKYGHIPVSAYNAA
jgi:alpha-acetolactate decarboxylase